MNVNLPSARIPITTKGDSVSSEFYRWMHDVTASLGGVGGATVPDIVTSQFDDAGIPEQQAELFALANAIGQLPNRVAEVEAENQRLAVLVEELRGVVYILAKRMHGLEEGTMQ